MPKAPIRVIAKPVDPATIRRAAIFTLGRRRALMEQLEHRRVSLTTPRPVRQEIVSEPAD